ncbi:MAG TPA: rod shape-determining protein MreD [Tepidisphaeraceae bacterium]|jgi:rod shape-determining protein MreD|nr:rod shape-determining protein MreD [Tepidisphaeraceae bacterium]
MRWLSYFILAYVTLGLQAGVAHAMQWKTAEPNLVLLAVVFIALNAPRDAALLGCFILGVMQDLASGGTMGLFAFSYGLVALFITAIQQAVHRRHPLTHFTVALIGGILTAIILAIHGWVRPPGIHAMPLFFTAIYSAVLAPFVIGPLQRMNRVFRFQRNLRN